MSLCSDKRDILDLVKLSYIIVRTGIGTGQIQVKHYFTASLSVCCFVKKKKNFERFSRCLVTHTVFFRGFSYTSFQICQNIRRFQI